MKCLIAAFLLVLALPAVLSETKAVTGKAGQSITLHTGVTGLHGDYQILWSYGPRRHVLVNYNDGELVRIASDRYQLDSETGCFTIHSLSPEDAGSYKGQIVNGNGSTLYFDFNLIVEKAAEPSTDTEGSSPDSAADQKTRVVAVLAVAVGVVLFA